MKILFLNPPYHKKFSRSQRSPAVTKSGTLYYPMWLSYAAACAEKAGNEIDLIDAPADGYEVEICGKLKDAFPGVFVLLVGTHVTALPEESLKLSNKIDAIAVGEFDYTVRETAHALSNGGDIGSVQGLCYWKDGVPVMTERRPPIEDLDDIPFVSSIYKRFLRIGNYFNPNALFPMVTITTSRGCPFQCIFCVYPQTMMGHRLRLRSVKNVVDEIEYIAGSFHGIEAIFFEDDTFTAIKKRCLEISGEIIRRNIKISWTINARADLDFDTMKTIKAAGCRSMCVGFESGSQHLLDTIKKRVSIENMERFMADARKAGILVHGCFMVGHPGETNETMNDTLELAKRLNPDTVQFYPIMVYPGTKAYDWYKEKGHLITDDFSKWLTPGGLHSTVVKTDNLSAEDLVRFCDRARREFYLRPGYLWYKLKQTVSNPSEMRRNLKSARTFFKYLIKGSDVEQKSC
jgi:radical SAM superfamily enzyme YgiQ (UPF0313 family)